MIGLFQLGIMQTLADIGLIIGLPGLAGTHGTGEQQTLVVSPQITERVNDVGLLVFLLTIIHETAVPFFAEPHISHTCGTDRSHCFRNDIREQSAHTGFAIDMQLKFIDYISILKTPWRTIAAAGSLGLVIEGVGNLHHHGHVSAGDGKSGSTLGNLKISKLAASGRALTRRRCMIAHFSKLNIPVFIRICLGFS